MTECWVCDEFTLDTLYPTPLYPSGNQFDHHQTRPCDLKLCPYSTTTIRGRRLISHLWKTRPRATMSSNPVSGARIAVVQFDPKFCASTDTQPQASTFRP